VNHADIARAALVALIATACSAIPIIALLTSEMEAGPSLTSGFGYLVIALLGNFLIGLPIALFTYWCIGESKNLGLWHLIGLANLVACISLLLLANGGAFGLIFFGVPIAISANVFAIIGWLVVVGPKRAKI